MSAEYSTEKVTELIAEARRPVTDLVITQSLTMTRALIRRLADALEAEHKRAEGLVEDMAELVHPNSEFVYRIAAERDELRAVIAEAQTALAIGGFPLSHYERILSRIPEHDDTKGQD